MDYVIWTIEAKIMPKVAIICRLVTIDVALPISFGANSPGLGEMFSRIRVHVDFPYHLDSRIEWVCVFMNGVMSKEG